MQIIGVFYCLSYISVTDMYSIYMTEDGMERLSKRPYRDPLVRLKRPMKYISKKGKGFGLAMTIQSRTLAEYEEFKRALINGEKKEAIHELEVALREVTGIPELSLELCVDNVGAADENVKDSSQAIEDVDTTQNASGDSMDVDDDGWCFVDKHDVSMG